MPYYGYDCKTANSYGIRGPYLGSYFPGEQQASTPAAPNCRAVKMSSLYQPSRMPYLVDTCSTASDSSGNVLGLFQANGWYQGCGTFGNGWGNSGALHLRHSKRGNVWMPDGHVASWGASDTYEFRCPDAGTINATGYRFGYSY